MIDILIPYNGVMRKVTGICAVEGCDRPIRSRGWCHRHHLRWLKHGDPRGGWVRESTMEERFWLSVDKQGDEDCWNWKLTTDRNGYGRLWTGERTAKGSAIRVMAHRYAYEQFVGEIPEGLLVLHRCDNPSCCNPSHLWVGTQSENVQDSIAKGRWMRNRKSAK